MTLGSMTGATGCFQDQVMNPDAGDDDQTAPGDSDGMMFDESGDPPLTTGATQEQPGDGSGGSGRSTTGMLDGGSDHGDDDVTGGSTSGEESEDDTTGDPVVGVDALVPGDLVVTEIMINPHCHIDTCEWIEIYNATDAVVNLLDLFIQDGGYQSTSQGRVTDDVFVPPGGLAVIARGDNSWPYEFTPAAFYGPNPGLDNGEPDRVVLRNSVEILDETASFYDPGQGMAQSLSASAVDAEDNDVRDAWCDATMLLPSTSGPERGSPGLPNPPC